MEQDMPIILLFIVLFAFPVQGQTTIHFDDFFLDKTMRMDYFHTGNAEREIISLDVVYEEPASVPYQHQLWAGSRINLIDTLNMGKYLLKVVDIRTNQLIYSRGFCSYFGEWQTTDEAANGIHRTFHESVLFPYPKREVQVILANRDKQNHFYEIFSTTVVPESRFVNRERHHEGVKVRKVMENGVPSQKVDLLILGDGYTEKEMSLFRGRVDHFIGVLFGEEPFKSRKKDFNVWAIEAPSANSGIDEPRKNLWRSTLYGCSYNSLDLPRYVLTQENEAIRNMASAAPYDQLYILLNSGRYGGGGIYNLYAITYAFDEGEESQWWPDYVFIHEFGHSFAGLGDEYYSSDVAYSEFYPQDVDPWEPNVGIVTDHTVKWQSMVEKNIPIPTFWQKAKYDSLSAAIKGLDATAPDYSQKKKRVQDEMTTVLTSDPHWGKVGAFQGSGYASEGFYRPALDCRMFSKSLSGFCPVCKRSIEKVIDFYAK